MRARLSRPGSTQWRPGGLGRAEPGAPARCTRVQNAAKGGGDVIISFSVCHEEAEQMF